MKNLFHTETYNATIDRLNNLSPDSMGQWGKMTVSQMLAHCKEAFKVPLTEKKMPRVLIGQLIGWAFKSKLYNEAPWKKNLPTAPAFKITDERIFETEKAQLYSLIEKFYTLGPEKAGRYPHPMFGKFSPDQWGQAMYKHLDHHFRQFGV